MLSFFISWMFPTKDFRRQFRELCNKCDDEVKVNRIQKSYHNVIKRLQKKYKKDKIKVIFLNTSASKFAYKYIYREFADNPNFEPLVLIYPYEFYVNSNTQTVDYIHMLDENYAFFRKNNYNVQIAFDKNTKNYIPLQKYNADIVFYEQPYYDAIPKLFRVENVYKKCLTMFCSYGSQITNSGCDYLSKTYPQLFRYFLDNSFIKDFLITKKRFKGNNLEVVGQSKLDTYLEAVDYTKQIWKSKNKKRIIWAPHFSFFESSILRFGTFDWNYEFMYDFAKAHQEYEFILKPHPEFRRFIETSGLMTLSELEEYYNKWTSLPNAQVYEYGEYFDMFRTSDVMITDCNSFLYEYLPTLKPIIHLIRETSVGHNKFGKEIIKGYYPARNLEELQNTINDIICAGEDPLLETRKYIVKNVLSQPEEGTAKYITSLIDKILIRKNK